MNTPNLEARASVLAASTIGAALAVAVVATFASALSASAVLAAAALGGAFGYAAHVVLRDPRACVPHFGTAGRLGCFALPQLLVVVGVGLYAHRKFGGEIGLVRALPLEGILGGLLACLFLGLFFAIPEGLDRFFWTCGRRLFWKANSLERRWKKKGVAPRDVWHVVLFSRADFSFGHYLKAGFGRAVTCAIGITLVYQMVRASNWAHRFMDRHETVFLWLAAIVFGAFILSVAWAGVVALALQMRRRQAICSSLGAALGSVGGVILALRFGLVGTAYPLGLCLVGGSCGYACGWLAIWLADVVIWVAKAITPDLLAEEQAA